MAHLDFVRPGVGGPGWTGEVVPGAQDFQRWDVSQTKFVDGINGGGTYAPTSPIIVGGQGIQVTIGASCYVQATGGVTTKNGGRIRLGAIGAPPAYASGQSVTRTFRIWDLPWQYSGPFSTFGGTGVGAIGDTALVLSTPPSPMGVTMAPGTTALAQVLLPIEGRHLFHGNSSVISSYSVTFRVKQRPASLPAALFGITLTEYNVGAGTNIFIPSTALAPLLQAWTASTVMTLNHYSGPVAAPNGLYYKATTVVSDAKTGGGEPAWPTTIGATVVDNHVTWTCIGGNGKVNLSQSVDSFYNGGNPQSVTYVVDAPISTTCDNTAKVYALGLNNLDPNLLLHTLTIGFSAVATASYG